VGDVVAPDCASVLRHRVDKGQLAHPPGRRG
jgi:hypothetical protein